MNVMPKQLEELRCVPLLVSLMTLLLAYPYLQSRAWVMGLLATGVMVGAIVALSRRRATLIAAVATGVPATAAHWFGLDGVPGLSALLLWLAFCGTTVSIVLCYVFRRGVISTDKLIGAVCVYLLLGLLFTGLHHLVFNLDPDAYVFLRQPDPNVHQCWADLLYFSFVTLTTLGFGDIAPVSSPARGLTIIESVTGVLYMAVLVAWIVGLYRQPKPPAGGSDDRHDG